MSPDASSAPPSALPILMEHEQVRVVRRFSDAGHSVEPGDVGTIVHVHDGRVAFEVEFGTDDPFVVTAPAGCLERA